MNKIEYPSQNNLYLNLEMVNGSNKVKIMMKAIIMSI